MASGAVERGEERSALGVQKEVDQGTSHTLLKEGTKMSIWSEFANNVMHNLFKPLLLFFYAGFLIPILGVRFEFPKPLYKALTIYLLLAIGWHGGEELAGLPPSMYGQAGGLMVIGFFTNLVIGVLAYAILRYCTKIRAIDAATISGYYGSDSAGTFVTCMGMLVTANIAFAPYMPVLLAVMEIPGCLVALYLVSRLRQNGMDSAGNMPGEAGYGKQVRTVVPSIRHEHHDEDEEYEDAPQFDESVPRRELVAVVAGAHEGAHGGWSPRHGGSRPVRGHHGPTTPHRTGGHDSHGHNHVGGHNHDGSGNSQPSEDVRHHEEELAEEARMALEDGAVTQTLVPTRARKSIFSKELLHEVFLNPGIFLLFAGVTIGFLARLQGEKVTAADDPLFVLLFQGILCLFLLEMGITASSKLRDLKTAGWRFVLFGLLSPNLFAGIGLAVIHAYSAALGVPFSIGTYVLFAVLCGAASYIAVPAVQRMAIPEASPTLPLASALGLTFTYNVTIGIPLYVLVATALTRSLPVG